MTLRRPHLRRHETGGEPGTAELPCKQPDWQLRITKTGRERATGFTAGAGPRLPGTRRWVPPGRYLGWATYRRYGFKVLKPCGYFSFASSSDTDVGMMTSSPGFQFTGVATVCFAFSCNESSRRSTSSKLRPALIGYTSMALTFLSGPMMHTERTVAF